MKKAVSLVALLVTGIAPVQSQVQSQELKAVGHTSAAQACIEKVRGAEGLPAPMSFHRLLETELLGADNGNTWVRMEIEATDTSGSKVPYAANCSVRPDGSLSHFAVMRR